MNEVFAKIVNRWPVELRDYDWPERNHVFKSEDEYRSYCEINSDAKPIVVDAPPEALDQSIWLGKLAAGWVDPDTGIKLKTTEPARILFSDAMVLMREELDAGEITGETLRPIWDYDEQMHVLKVNDLRALLRRYGNAWQQMFAEFAP